MSMVKKGMPHHDKIVALKRIEGQVRGVQKMIDEQRYCVDILNATSAVIGALKKVESRILKDHLNACARTAFEGKSQTEKEKKMQEIFRLLEGNRG